MIEINNIEKNLATNMFLKNLSTKFEQGKINLVIGESGSGKTTLIKILVGLYKHDSGTVLFDKKILGLMRNKETRKLQRNWNVISRRCSLRLYDGRRKHNVSIKYVYQ